MASVGPKFAVPEGFAAEASAVKRVKERLQAKGVKTCFATFVDIYGIPKAKATPLSHFESMCNGSELYTVGAVEGLGLRGPQEDECATIPDLDTAVVLPWDSSQAWLSANLFYHGELYAGDARGLLQKVLKRASTLGFGLNLGIEPEFFVFSADETGARRPITRSQFRGPNACYDLNLATESMPFLEPMVRYMEELDWGVYSFDQECGRGQYEFDFAYCDALKMADRFIFLRFMAKKVAESIDAVASFMPKPFADDFRSGAHFNLSLYDLATGENAFAPVGQRNTLAAKYDVRCSDTALHFIAGLRRHAAAITALACPTYNSYQGLIAQGELSEFSWAPVLCAWGKNNRSAMLRLPGNRYCVENRAVDMAVNPYLAAALMLEAGLRGVEEELDPGEPLNEDLYQRGPSVAASAQLPTLPKTLLHALEALEADPLVDDVLGAYKSVYVAHKMDEWNRNFYRVSQEQRDESLTFI